MDTVREEEDLTCPHRGCCHSGVEVEALSCYSKCVSVHTCTSTLACFPHHLENQIHDSKENSIASHTSLRAVYRSASTETPTAMLCDRSAQAGVPVRFPIYYQECLHVIVDKHPHMIQMPCCRHHELLSACRSRREWESGSAPLRTIARGRFGLNSNGIAGEGVKEAPPENAQLARVTNGDEEGEELVSDCDGEGDGEGDAESVDGSSFSLRRAGGTRELSGTQSLEKGCYAMRGHPWLVGSPLRPLWHLTSLVYLAIYILE